MRPLELVIATAVAVTALVQCNTSPEEGGGADSSQVAAAETCGAQWNPSWQQGSGANNWWVEYAIAGNGKTVSSAHLEVVGVKDVPLSFAYDKWRGSPGARIATGAPVSVHATATDGTEARTVTFGYLTQTRPVTQCEASTCPFDPSWQQGSGANNWWAEYVIDAPNIVSASVEVVGVRSIMLASRYGKWVGSTGASSIATGTTVVVHATNASGQSVETKPFGYLSETRPTTACAVCVPSCSGKRCGGDGCGGTCGSCGSAQVCVDGSCAEAPCFHPTFQQGSGANEWWAEYTITNGTVTSASLEVVGGRTVPLTLRWNKWSGSTGGRILTGTSVVVHATNDVGQTVKTVPFGYLAVQTPQSEPCTCVRSCAGLVCGDDGCGGSCGTCPTNRVCSAGGQSCMCPPLTGDCDGEAANGCETSLVGTLQNCGSCGHTCPTDGTQYCGGSLFSLPSCRTCPSGTRNCDGTGECETNVLTNHASCGSCGNACAANQVCDDGSCASACTAPLVACNGACFDIQKDTSNCGSCGHVCSPGQLCVQGTCLTCAYRTTDCDGEAANGCETSLLSRYDCGFCGMKCGDSQYCGSYPGFGILCLSCPSDQRDCDAIGGCEVNVATDSANCGACGHVCPAGTVCSAATCQPQ